MRARPGGTLIIQPSPGIGDMIWHLPHIRAIARAEGPLTLLTKPRNFTKDWLAHDPCLREILYVERQGLSLSLPALLKRRFQKAWVLHRSTSYAALPFFAGVPERVGFGVGFQRHLLTSNKILTDAKAHHTIENLNAFLDLHGLDWRTESSRPPLMPEAERTIQQLYGHLPRPWMILGIGGSAVSRRWPLDAFTHTLAQILPTFPGTVFLCGSAAERPDAEAIKGALNAPTEQVQIPALPIDTLFGLLAVSDLYLGNDTSLLNICATFGVPAVGLFGTSSLPRYVPTLHMITTTKDCMSGIQPAQVLKYLGDHNLLKGAQNVS